MVVRIGTEIGGYGSHGTPTGVERVMREVHRHVTSFLERGVHELLPVITSPAAPQADRPLHSYVASDPLLNRSPVDIEDLDCLLILDPLAPIDFRSIDSLRRRRGLPVICMIHDIMPLQRADWFVPGAPPAFRRRIQEILHCSDHIVVPSHQVESDLRSLGWHIRPRIHVIGLGSWIDVQPPRRICDDPLRLIYVSTLAPRKGHRRLLAAYDDLKRRGLDVTLTLIGKVGWDVDDLLDDIESHPDFGTSLMWWRDVDDDLVCDHLRSSHIGVIPTDSEGFGLFVEEALSAGLMVVATDIPVFRERSNPNLILCPPSVDGLSSAIVEASTRQPTSLRSKDIRSMRDFARDLTSLIVEVGTWSPPEGHLDSSVWHL